MATVNVDRFPIKQLDGTNYFYWSFGIRSILCAKGLFGVVDPYFGITNAEGKIEDSKAPSLEDQLAWQEKNQKAMGIIVTAVSEKLHCHLMECTTAKDMWSILKARY